MKKEQQKQRSWQKHDVTDSETLKIILEGKRAIKAGAKGVPVSKLFNAVRAKRK